MSSLEYESPLDSCSGDIRDCEILRAAFALKSTEQANDRAQEMRRNLAMAACTDCCRVYLHDIDEPGSIPLGPRSQESIFASQIIWVDETDL